MEPDVTPVELMVLARNGDERAFAALVEPHRRELQLHCYRILGSLHDAEDALQETMLAAWKAFPKYEDRSLRGWLYRIATSRCLNMLRTPAHRHRATEPMHDVELPEPSRVGEVLWLEPYPDMFLEGIADDAPGPEARYESREAVSLAFVTAMQLLPPRQRAVLILRDVLGYRAAEAADMLDVSLESVTSALKRARTTLQGVLDQGDSPPPAPRSPAEQSLVEQFVRAFESRDVPRVVALLTNEVRFTMPPLPAVWQGHVRAAAFLEAMMAWAARGHRALQTRANGQPAVALYVADPHSGLRRGVGLLVLTLSGERISAITRFDPALLERFSLPRTLRHQVLG